MIDIAEEQSIRILVLDDDVVDRREIIRQLRSVEIDVEIHEADSLLQGKEQVKTLEWDCIIVDYRLPDGNGVDFIKFMQQENILTPVIVLTGQGDTMIAVESMKAGAVDYLVKGQIKPEMLLQAIFAGVRLRKAQLAAQSAQAKAVRAEKTAFLGTMIAGLAHEITQPLNAIKLAAGVLLYRHRKGEEITMEKMLDTLETIHARCERIEGIINEVRGFISSGCVPVSAPCDLRQAVNNVLNMLQDKITDSGIAVHNCLPLQLPAVWGEMQLLEKIIANIVLNAIHAVEDGKKPDKRIYLEGSFDKWVRLRVSDNGTGIDEETKEKIFHPFFTTKNSGRGMGLGLAVVHAAIMALDGEISCENNVMGGASFTISLPGCPDDRSA